MAQARIDGLHTRVEGDGAPVIALHDTASTGAQWLSLVEYIAGRYRILTPDLPGHGGSRAHRSGGGLTADAQAIAALIDHAGGPAHLVGHGYGGAVALRLAAMRPDALRSLTLIEPASFYLLRRAGGRDRLLYGELAALATRVFGHAIAGSRVGAMREFVDYWVGRGAWARTSAGLQASLLGGLDGLCADIRAVMFEEGTLADLRRIGVPTLAVMGLESPAPSLRLTELIAEHLPRAVLTMVAEAGHMVPLTDPHVVDPMIAGHLVEVDRAAGRAAAAA
jgi:lipase